MCKTQYHLVWGDAAYSGQHEGIRRYAPSAHSFVQTKSHRHRPLSERERAGNRTKSKVWARVEHACLVIKRTFWIDREGDCFVQT